MQPILHFGIRGAHLSCVSSHTHARDVIRSGLGRPVDYQMLIEDTKFSASEQLVEEFALDDVEKVWQELGMNISSKSLLMKLPGTHVLFYSTVTTLNRLF